MSSIPQTAYAFYDDYDLDREWVSLLKEAQDLGITVEEIRAFLKSKGVIHRKEEKIKKGFNDRT